MGAEDRAEVEAAGGVVLRHSGGRTEVVLVHRPHYDDWTIPKGKLDRGESFEAAALREVEEETGLVCRTDGELASARYSVKGKSKLVRYWRMRVRSGRAAERPPDGEVDEARWVDVEEAAELLTHPRDAEILAEAVAT